MATPRILRITVRSAHTGKIAWVMTKVPYGGIYMLSEQLSRALSTGEILWFRVEAAPPRLITDKVRKALQRWPEALRSMSERTGINWLA